MTWSPDTSIDDVDLETPPSIATEQSVLHEADDVVQTDLKTTFMHLCVAKDNIASALQYLKQGGDADEVEPYAYSIKSQKQKLRELQNNRNIVSSDEQIEKLCDRLNDIQMTLRTFKDAVTDEERIDLLESILASIDRAKLHNKPFVTHTHYDECEGLMIWEDLENSTMGEFIEIKGHCCGCGKQYEQVHEFIGIWDADKDDHGDYVWEK